MSVLLKSTLKKILRLSLDNRSVRRIYNKCVFDYETALALTEKRASYAASGEDCVAAYLLRFFTKIGDENIRYLDIGSHHPTEGNNTYYFYRRGGRGVLVEPNPIQCERSRRLRPADKTINAGVAFTEDATEATYYMFERDTLNTFSSEWAQLIPERKGVRMLEKRTVPLIQIETLLRDEFDGTVPDFVSIDVEGLETDVLRTIDLNSYRPPLVLVEVAHGSVPLGEEFPVEKLLKQHDYLLVANTGVNLFFLAKEYFSSDRMLFGDKIVLTAT